MLTWLLLVSILSLVNCRPQVNPPLQSQHGATVEVKKPDVFQPVQPFFNPKPIEDEHKSHYDKSTREILEKIAQVNEKQGLKKRNKQNPYQHFSLGYLRSSKGNNEFRFPKDPFTNPILDYVEKENGNFYGKVAMNQEQDDMMEDDVPEGHYVKRKITHHQTMLVPATMPAPFQPFPPGVAKPPNKTRFDLEQQTVDNIKHIVGVPNNGYYQQQPLGLQNYHQQALGYHPGHDQANYQPSSYYQPSYQQLGYPQYGYNPYYYNPYYNNPYYQEQEHQQRPDRQFSWNWPGAQYFPITIRDPVVQMYNAVTSMIEYGMGGGGGGGGGGGCKNKPKTNDDQTTEPRETPETSTEIPTEPTTILEIEDLRITGDPVQNLTGRESKKLNFTRKYTSTTRKPTTGNFKQHSPPIRDFILHDDELYDYEKAAEEEADKAEDVQISNDGNKKFFSKDNTGSGIFIKKIKVRKGGVAIAGPGGIATAGSGGTAIVGPNGWAYTQPNSLAIAGSGTKVVAVEPTVNLEELINGTNPIRRGQGHVPPRVGKVVAVGPVVYYNKG